MTTMHTIVDESALFNFLKHGEQAHRDWLQAAIRAFFAGEPRPEVDSIQVMNTAPDFLHRAATIMEERGKQYDKPGGERSMGKTVAAFNAITGQDMTEEQGWAFMLVLKQVRFFSNTTAPHRDSLEDAIAYSALLAESALKGEAK